MITRRVSIGKKAICSETPAIQPANICCWKVVDCSSHTSQSYLSSIVFNQKENKITKEEIKTKEKQKIIVSKMRGMKWQILDSQGIILTLNMQDILHMVFKISFFKLFYFRIHNEQNRIELIIIRFSFILESTNPIFLLSLQSYYTSIFLLIFFLSYSFHLIRLPRGFPYS